jgi:hypothetical protein
MSNPKRPTARVADGGYLQVAISEPPGCLARVERWLRRAAWAALWFGLGVIVGMVLRVFG